MFDLQSDQFLNSQELLSKYWQNSYYANIFKAIDKLKDSFQSLYSSKIQKCIDECQTSGMSGQFDSFEMRSMSSAGRLLITLEDFQDAEGADGIKTQITFICAEGEKNPRMGWQSFYGSFSEIKILVIIAIFTLEKLSYFDLCEKYKSDRNVSIV